MGPKPDTQHLAALIVYVYSDGSQTFVVYQLYQEPKRERTFSYQVPAVVVSSTYFQLGSS